MGGGTVPCFIFSGSPRLVRWDGRTWTIVATNLSQLSALEVWGSDVYVTDRVIDNHVVALRKKIEEDPTAPRYLLSVRGMGYRFEG